MQEILSKSGSGLITVLICVCAFGAMVFVHEFGHFITAKLSGIKVNEFAIGMGPVLFKKQRKETQYALRLLPIGGYVSMEGEDEESEQMGSFTRAPVGSRILVTVAGACMNILLGFVILLVIISASDNIVSRQIAKFYPNAATEAAGLKVGDTILAANGRRCFIDNDILYEFARTQNATVDLTVMRDGKKVELDGVKFDTKEVDGQAYLVIDFVVYATPKTFSSVIRESVNWTLSYGRLVILSLFDLVTGHVQVNSLSGPVGIVSVINDTASYGWQSVLQLLALLTINMGIFNLVPFPALDGGRLFLLIIEAIRRKPIAQKYEIAINAVGFTLLMGLMVFVTFNDITKLFK